MKAHLTEELKIRVRGVPPLERLAGMIVVGMQVRHLKIALDYMRQGRRALFLAEKRPLWEEVCIAQFGFTDTTERNLHDCARAVRARLEKAGYDEAREVLKLMDPAPADLSDEDRGRLVEGIRLYALREGDTLLALRKESRSAKDGIPGETGDAFRMLEVECFGGMTDKHRRVMIATALACGLSEERAEEIADLIVRRDNEETLRLVSVAGEMIRQAGGIDRFLQQRSGEEEGK